MKTITWNKEKNIWLKEKRRISFEELIYYLDNGFLLDDTKHPNQRKYPGQRIMIIDVKGYVNLVPYIETENEVFLKTIMPSRKATKKYLGV